MIRLGQYPHLLNSRAAASAVQALGVGRSLSESISSPALEQGGSFAFTSCSAGSRGLT